MAEQKEDSKVPLTKEEVEKRKAEMTTWHNEQIPFLETQFTYENLITKIQQAHTDRLEAEYKWIQLKAAMMENLVSGEPNEESKRASTKEATMSATRTLKKDKNDTD